MPNYRVIVIATGNNTRKDIMGNIRGEQAHTSHRDAIIYEHYLRAPNPKRAEHLTRLSHGYEACLDSECYGAKKHATRIAYVGVTLLENTLAIHGADGMNIAFISNDEDEAEKEKLILSQILTFTNGKNFDGLPRPTGWNKDVPNSFIWRRKVATSKYYYPGSEGDGPTALFSCSYDLASMLRLISINRYWEEVKQPNLV